MKNTSRIVQGVVLLLIVLLATGCRGTGISPATQATSEAVPTGPRATDSCRMTALATILPAQRIRLGFRASGPVSVVHVQVGDQVRAGDVLARIDHREARKALTNAELQVAKAELELDTARLNHRKLLQQASEADLLEARAAVGRAKEKLADLKADASEAELGSAEATMASAEEAYQRLLDGPEARDVERRELEVSRAKNSLWLAQMSRDAKGGQRDRDSSAHDQAQAIVLNAEISVRLAEMALEELKGPTPQAELREARAKVAQAQENLAELGAGASAADVASAEAELAQAKGKLEKLLEGPSDEDIAISEDKVRQAELTLAQARLALESAQGDQEYTALVAPFEGTVSAVYLSPGEWGAPGTPVVELLDTTRWRAETRNVSELDIAQVKVGQQALVRVMALGDEELQGRIITISPVAVVQQGDTTYTAIIELEPADLNLRPGMNARVQILTE